MNAVILVGNLARDPELCTTQSGVALCNLTIAVNRRFANADGQREADFINCVAWRQTAEFIHKYFQKGQKIVLRGSLQTRSYDAQDGSKRYVTEVMVDEAEFAAPRAEGPASAQASARPSMPQSRPAQQRMDLYGTANDSGAGQADMQGFTEVEDDDLPF